MNKRLRTVLQTIKGFLVPQQIEKLFLRWFLLIALPLCFILPPYMGPDEASHVYRAYEFSKGDINQDLIGPGFGYRIAEPVVKLNQSQFWENSRQPFLTALHNNIDMGPTKNGKTVVQYFENTSVYSPLGYLHFIIVTFLTQLFNINAYAAFILLRLVNIALYASLAYWAIKLTPKRKLFMLMAALFPMAIHQATVVSPDGLINGSALLAVAIAAKLIVDKRSSTPKLLALLGAATFIVAFSKQAYLFFPLFLLVVPAAAFAFKRLNKTRYIAAVVLVTLTCLGAWTLFSGASAAHAFSQWRLRDNFGETKTTSQFVKNIVLHPGTAAVFVIHSSIYNIAPVEAANLVHPEYYAHNQWANFTPTSFLGSFGSLMVGYPMWVYPVVLAGLALPLAAEKFTYLPRLRDRRVILAVLGIVFVTLGTVLWLKWTSVRDPAIVGFQGRYLIPLLGLLMFLPTGKHFRAVLGNAGSLPKYLVWIIFVQSLMMLIVVADRFYS